MQQVNWMRCIRGSKISLLLVAILVMPLILEMPTILYLWLGIVPDYAVIFARLVLLLTLFDAYSPLLATAKGATGNIKTYQVTLTTIGLFHLPLTWICFELGWEPYWAQIVYLIIIIVLQIVRTWFVCRSIRLSQRLFYQEVVGRCFLSVGLALVAPALLHRQLEQGLVTTLIVCCSCMALSCIAAFFIGLNRHERVMIFNQICNRIKGRR